MPRNPMSADAMQLFRGGLNKPSLWAEHIGGDCCDPKALVAMDRLPPTVNPENANVHTNPYGHRDYWHFGTLADSIRQKIVDHINSVGVGAELEVMVIPTFALLHSVRVDVLIPEAGLAFELVTRNGTALPTGQEIIVTETDSGDGCGEVARVQTAPGEDDSVFEDIGGVGAGTRRYHLGVSDQGGEFALEADVLILRVTAVPAAPGVIGFFDIQVHANYVAPGRSEAPR